MEYLTIILVSFSVIAYAGIVGYTLYIANQRRKNAIRPYLVLPKTNLDIYWKSMGEDEYLFPGIWSNTSITDEKFIAHGIDCINIGQGSAVDVVVEWLVDVKGFIKMIKAQDRGNIFRFDYYEKQLSVEIRLPRGKHPTMGFKWLNAEGQENISHVLPFHLDKTPIKIITPKTYLLLLSVYYYLVHINKGYGNIEKLYAKLPEFNVILNYRDIEGNRYYAEHVISFSVVEQHIDAIATEKDVFLVGLIENIHEY